jgi:hypothetical protein
MLNRSVAALLAGVLLTPVVALAAPRDQMLVSPAWLKSHLADRQLVLLQIGERGEFDKEHIPGARYLDFESLSGRSGRRALPRAADGGPTGFDLRRIGRESRFADHPVLRIGLGEPDYAGMADRSITWDWEIALRFWTEACPHGKRPATRSPPRCLHRQRRSARQARPIPS